MSLEPNTNLPRLIAHALEDDSAHPLKELVEEAPDESLSFSDFEKSVSEWSFGYGVAWALARVRDPFLSSQSVGAVADGAVREAWRTRTGNDFWAAMMMSANGRGDGMLHGGPGTQLDQFMQQLGAMRERPGEPEDTPEQS
jgi:hypothetical protein